MKLAVQILFIIVIILCYESVRREIRFRKLDSQFQTLQNEYYTLHYLAYQDTNIWFANIRVLRQGFAEINNKLGMMEAEIMELKDYTKMHEIPDIIDIRLMRERIDRAEFNIDALFASLKPK